MLQSNDKSNKKFDLYNIKIKSKHKSKFMKDSKNKFFISNNFTPMINIQTQSININGQKKDINNEEFLSLNKNNGNKKAKKHKKDNTNKKLNDNVSKNENKIKKNSNKKKSLNKKIKQQLKKFDKEQNIHNLQTIENKKIGLKEMNNNDKMNKYSNNYSDLQEMSYEQAIIYDKRSFLRMYWSFLAESQVILGTFCLTDYLHLYIIKLSFLVFTFQINFFLNALFYTDEYISDAYHNDGVLDFFSGLPKSIYSFVATLIVTNILRMLTNSKNEFIKIIKRRDKINKYEEVVNMKLKKLRIKLIVYFILIYLMDIFFLYYVTAFCAVYRNSQKYWFIGCLESFGLDFLISVIICIFLTIFRYLSIRKRIKCLFILVEFISALS